MIVIDEILNWTALYVMYTKILVDQNAVRICSPIPKISMFLPIYLEIYKSKGLIKTLPHYRYIYTLI